MLGSMHVTGAVCRADVMLGSMHVTGGVCRADVSDAGPNTPPDTARVS